MEVLQPKGLEQVVDSIDTKAFYGIFRIGRRKDDEWRYGERLHKIHAVEVGHVDVTEDGIHGVIL